MYDRELALEILTQIYESTQTILKRFEPVKSVEDFTGSDEGMEKLDSICMQLIAIGEGLKNLDKKPKTRVESCTVTPINAPSYLFAAYNS